MATGFSENEMRLSRAAAAAMRRGVTEAQLGMTGKRTVGPLVTMVAVNGRAVYAINNEHGITLGRTVAESLATLRALLPPASPEVAP